MLSLPQLNFVRIADYPSEKVQKVLEREDTLESGNYYLALGFLGDREFIVLVDQEGSVVTIPYDEESFSV